MKTTSMSKRCTIPRPDCVLWKGKQFLENWEYCAAARYDTQPHIISRGRTL